MSTATPATAGQTGPAAPAVTAPPRTVGPPPSALRRTLRYAGHTTRMTVTNIFFMLFTIALPVGMYLLFGMLIGEQDGGQVRGLIMVNMAAYGGLEIGRASCRERVEIPAVAACSQETTK